MNKNVDFKINAANDSQASNYGAENIKVVFLFILPYKNSKSLLH